MYRLILLALLAAHLLDQAVGVGSGSGSSSWTTGPTTPPPTTPAGPCCRHDDVFIIEYYCFWFEGPTPPFNTFLKPLLNAVGTAAGCVDLRAAIVEYAKDISISFYLNTYNNTASVQAALGSFQLGPALSPDPTAPNYNIASSLEVTRLEILINARGWLQNNHPTTYAILIAAHNPINFTNSLAQALLLQQKATVVVFALGTNYTASILRALASGPQYFFQFPDFILPPISVLAQNPILADILCLPAPPTTFGTRPTTTPVTPSGFCFQCRDRRNEKDLYANPLDCHTYYQCFYYNETYAVGYLKHCASGTFWHDEILQCMPEGPIPCVDYCRNDNVTCYSDPSGNCVSFFRCANSASYQFCCPWGTTFNNATCECVTDITCTATCPRVVGTTTPAPTPYELHDGCVDAYDNFLRPVAGQPNAFRIFPSNAIIYCPSGLSFDVASCTCDIPTNVYTIPPVPSYQQCILWLPFDGDSEDHSINQFTTFVYGDAYVDDGVDATGTGTGSFVSTGGRLEVPGLKTMDMGSEASWCNNTLSPTQCLVQGGLLSNNEDHMATDYSIIMATIDGSAKYQLKIWHPEYSVSGSKSSIAGGWNQMCVIYDGSKGDVGLYINGALVNTQPATGDVKVAQCPYTVGDDQLYGNFIGRIDDVLVCRHALSTAEMAAHYAGNTAYLVDIGDIPA